MVKAKETNLEGVLEGKKQYQVPLYQRTYSWGRKQIDQLWEDIREIAEARTTDPTATHFVGSLVLAASPDNAAVGVQKFLVVDGQQRLTTLTLLLAALRDHQVATEGAHHRARIDDQYLINRYESGEPTKLLPTQGDRPAYLAVVRGAAKAGGEDTVGAAYRSLRAKIASADNPEDPRDIEALENAVLRGLAMVAVTAEPGDNAHRIFESLNNTGLRLTQADLLRNYLFMRLGDRAEAVYQSVWRPLEETLDADSLELLFWLDLVQTDEKATQSDTYLGQQRRLDKLASTEAIESEIRRIAALGDLLAIVLDPQRERDPGVRERLVRIQEWDSRTAFPLVLALLSRRAAGEASHEQVARALLYLESYFVRRVVTGRATNSLNRTLLQSVGAVTASSSVDVALWEYLSSGRRYYASDQQVRDAVHTVPFYWQGRAAQKKLILRWLEDSMRPKERVDPTGLTIEHVLPQTLTAEVITEFGADLELENVASEHDRLVHTLGNLTLSGYNSELSNRPFSAKRPMLAASGLTMNHAIADHDQWTASAIENRSAELGERIIELWPGPDETKARLGDPASEASAVVARVVAAIPAGKWTSYSEVAIVAGSHPVAVGGALATYRIPNAWRVLKADGTISPQFHWVEPDRTDDPREVLSAEGVVFDETGKAARAGFVDAEALAEEAGFDVDPEQVEKRRSSLGQTTGTVTVLGAQQLHFWTQLRGWGQENAHHISTWREPRQRHWMTLDNLGQTAAIELTLNSETNLVAAEVTISDNKALFHRLHEARQEIEDTLGFSLDWRAMPENKVSRIVVTREGDFRDEAQVQELIGWLVDRADALTRVFRERM